MTRPQFLCLVCSAVIVLASLGGAPAMCADAAPAQLGAFTWHNKSDRPGDAWLDKTAGPAGTPALILRAFPGKTARWVSDPLPVVPGRAYAFSAKIRSALITTQGKLEVQYRDSTGKQLALPGSSAIFDNHNFSPFDVTAVAPDGAHDAILRFDLSGTQGSSSGQAFLAAPTFGPSIDLWVGLEARADLIPPGKTAPAVIDLSGVPGATIDLSWQVTDFDAHAVAGASGNLRASGNGRSNFTLPALTPGYYTLSVRAEGQGLASTTRNISMGVIPPLAKEPPSNTPICLDAGMSWGCSDTTRHANLAAYVCQFAGLRELRDRLSWWAVEHEQGKFDWGQYRLAADAEARHGITVYQIFHDCPPWASVKVVDGKPHGHYPPRDPIYVYRMVNRLVHDLGKDVRYFEVWNEANIGFFKGRPEDYAAILKAAYLGAKDADPKFGILLASAAGTPGVFFDHVYDNDVAGYFDIYNQHWYGGPEALFGFMKGVRTQLANHGITGRPMWMTEMGYPVHPAADGTFAAPERDAARYLLRAYACGFANGFARFHYFYLQEFLEGSVSLWGIVRQDMTPKPAYVALATMIRQLGEAKCVGWTRLPSDGYAVFFRRAPGDVVAMAWSLKPGAKLEVPARGPIIDMVGREARPAHAGALSTMTITLGPDPVFIRGIPENSLASLKLDPPVPAPTWTPPADQHLAAKHVWLQLEVNPDKPRPLAFEAQQEKAGAFIDPGVPVTVTAWVNNYTNQSVTATVACAPDKVFTLDGPKEAKLTVGPWKRGRHDFIVTGHNMVAGQTLGVDVTMVAPLHTEKCRVFLRPRVTDLEPAVRTTIFDGNSGVGDWSDNSSPSLKTTITLDPNTKHSGKGSAKIQSEVVSAGDCWAFPRLKVPAGMDLSKYTGLELWSYVAPGQEGTRTLDVQLVEDGGGTYYIPAVRSLAQAGWQRALIRFSDAKPTTWGVDPDGKLELSKVRHLLIGWGGYRGRVGEKLTYWIDDVSAAKW